MRRPRPRPSSRPPSRSTSKETKGQVERLEKIFEGLGEKSPKGKTCKAMQGLVEEGSELMKEDIEPAVLDAGLIAAAQRVEHYEMAGYGTVRTYAKLLKKTEAAKLLQATLEEEAADRREAQRRWPRASINLQAV